MVSRGCLYKNIKTLAMKAMGMEFSDSRYGKRPENRSHSGKISEKIKNTKKNQDWSDDIDETIYDDKDEWSMWREREDPVLHIGRVFRHL